MVTVTGEGCIELDRKRGGGDEGGGCTLHVLQ